MKNYAQFAHEPSKGVPVVQQNKGLIGGQTIVIVGGFSRVEEIFLQLFHDSINVELIEMNALYKKAEEICNFMAEKREIIKK